MIKRLEELKFDEASHVYKVGDRSFPSVTGFVKQFFAPFNGQEIAAKMVEKRLKQGVQCTVQDIFNEWKAAAQHGTDVHKDAEDYINGLIGKDKACHTHAKVAMEYFDLFWKGRNVQLFPELRVYDAELGLAGTIDLCIQLPDGRIVLVDWKTNKAIWEKGFNENTNAVTGHLEDCNYVHYTLQLSTYAHMIERTFNVEIAHLLLVHLTDGGWKEHCVAYEKETVQKMLAHVNGG